MKYLNFLRHLFIGCCIGVIVFALGSGVADWYVDQLKASGGMVTADSILGAQMLPWVLSVLSVGAYMKIFYND